MKCNHLNEYYQLNYMLDDNNILFCKNCFLKLGFKKYENYYRYYIHLTEEGDELYTFFEKEYYDRSYRIIRYKKGGTIMSFKELKNKLEDQIINHLKAEIRERYSHLVTNYKISTITFEKDYSMGDYYYTYHFIHNNEQYSKSGWGLNKIDNNENEISVEDLDNYKENEIMFEYINEFLELIDINMKDYLDWNFSSNIMYNVKEVF